jgi:hypothetical protein
MFLRGLALAILWFAAPAGRDAANAADTAALVLETRIPLGNVAGRIDHLAFDPVRQRLYVAELGNDTVGIVDVKQQRLLRTVSGFRRPQGIAYEPGTDTIYVANGGDGSLRMFSGADFAALGSLALGEDADNVRVDGKAGRLYVGYGDGALAVIDATSRKRIADIPLDGHPESFQLDQASDRIYVNIPDANQIGVISRDRRQRAAAWPTGGLHENFPMALDPEAGRLFAVFRRPAQLVAYEMRSGRPAGAMATCDDSDDAFVDAKRHRLYVLCGQGVVETIDATADVLKSIGRLTTSTGSRTGLFVPSLDRLFVAVRAGQGNGAAIWVLRPGPP